ncbi:hypothetical protein BGX28_008403 [Mortierella sp. GBA30]|nr:hypothetical protein BGX28_008403 [Mortierella sp. GBA30]
MGGGYSLFTLEDYEHSMPCARNLSKAISIRTRNLNEKFLYVIFTDSDEMRRQVQQEYGDQIDLIFPPPPPPVSQTHPVQLHEGEEEMHYQELKVRRHGPDQGRQPWSKIMSAVDDEETNLFSSFLFSETDYQIITSTSFSKVALFRKGSQGRRSAVLMPNKRERATFEDRNLGSRDGHDVSAVKIQLPDCSSIEDAVTPWDVVASFGTLG